MATAISIDPAALYDDLVLYDLLDVSPAVLAAARRDGRLRYSRQGRRVLYLGQWVLDWLTADSSPAPAEGRTAHAD
jgi:hypothetical protein